MKEGLLNKSCSIELSFLDGTKRYFLILYNDCLVHTIIYHKYTSTGSIREFGLLETSKQFLQYYQTCKANRELPDALIKMIQKRALAESV